MNDGFGQRFPPTTGVAGRKDLVLTNFGLDAFQDGFLENNYLKFKWANFGSIKTSPNFPFKACQYDLG